LLPGVISNAIAQIVSLSELINQASVSEFRQIILRANLMAFTIFLFCAYAGKLILFQDFQISLDSMRIFGGVVTVYLAFNSIVKGPEGMKLFRGDVTELAQQITLPVMVGAGGVWASIKVGGSHGPITAAFCIAPVLLVNMILMLGYHRFYKTAKGRFELINQIVSSA